MIMSSGASQRLAFEEFTHQIPLRIDNIQNQSIGSSSEKELNSLSNFKSPSDVSLKRKRLSSLSSSSFESDNCYSSLSSLSGLRT